MVFSKRKSCNFNIHVIVACVLQVYKVCQNVTKLAQQTEIQVAVVLILR